MENDLKKSIISCFLFSAKYFTMHPHFLAIGLASFRHLLRGAFPLIQMNPSLCKQMHFRRRAKIPEESFPSPKFEVMSAILFPAKNREGGELHSCLSVPFT